MYKIYFRQAIQMLRQNAFISTISILGTALAIMMIMSMVVAGEVKNAAIGPEKNRDRMLYISGETTRDTIKGAMRSGSFRKVMYDEYISKLKTPEAIGLVDPYWVGDNSCPVSAAGSDDYSNLEMRMTNHDYWKVLTFTFVEGRPYSQEEFESGMKYAVISETAGRKIFSGESPLGKTIEVEFNPYTVVGVVKDVSPIFGHAYGDVWLPYTAAGIGQDSGVIALMLASSKKDFPAIIDEVRQCEKKFSVDHSPWIIYFKGPETQEDYSMKLMSNTDPQEYESVKAKSVRSRIAIIVILLLVPAVNLSGFSLSRIRKRTAEIGIRKAFGARKYIILMQVLYENMITSLIGGIIGLVFSYAAVYGMREWLLDIPSSGQIPVSAFFSPYVFLAAFAACLLINLISAGLPAYRASRTSIVDSLTQNER